MIILFDVEKVKDDKFNFVNFLEVIGYVLDNVIVEVIAVIDVEVDDYKIIVFYILVE